VGNYISNRLEVMRLFMSRRTFFGEPLMKSRPSWKIVRDQRRKENFVGRQEQLRVFSENFVGEVPNYMVFSVTGEGGVGKSTLLQQYANIASSSDIKAMVVMCDDRHTSPASAMGFIASELARREIRYKDFDDRYKRYRELREEIESDPKAPRGAVDLIARGMTDFVIKSGRKIPGVGVLLEGADEKAAGETLAQLINYGILRWGDKDEVLLLRETERVLTPLFLGLLANASEHHRLVLMFDVFERTCQSLSPWLLALFNFEYGEFDTNLTFTLSGRDPLEQHWTERAGTICHIMLDPFTPDETQLYLLNHGISDQRLVRQIHEDTAGLPVLVELLAATNPQPGVPLPDVSKDAVERFLQWIPQEDRRRVALLAAVPRQFNRDILSTAQGNDVTNMFAWLSMQSFVRRNAERGWFYHEKVRELMLRYLRHTTPKDLEEAHSRLAGFFADEQAKLHLEGRVAYNSTIWRILECERIYHTVGAQPDRQRYEAINAFFQAFRWRWRSAEAIAQALQQLGHETGIQALEDWAFRLLEIYKAYDQGEYLIGIERLSSLESQGEITTAAHCEILALRGIMSFQAGKWEQALADLNHAIVLDERNARAIASRGNIYQLLGEYEKGLADITRAIELDPQNAWAIGLRGDTCRLMGQYEEALVDLTRANALDAKLSWVMASRGDTYRLMGQYEKAVADFTHAIELDAQDAKIIGLRGKTYRLMGQYEEALADLSRAIEFEGQLAWAITDRAVTYRLMGQYEEALADLTCAIELDVRLTWAIGDRGKTYWAMGHYEEAIADFTRAIDLDAQDGETIGLRGNTYLRMGQYEEALADLTRAIELHDRDWWSRIDRGKTYCRMGQYEEAIADFTKAMEIDDADISVLSRRAAPYLAVGNTAAAQADLAKVREVRLERGCDYYHCGVALILSGEYDEAIEMLRQAFERDVAMRIEAETDDLLDPIRNLPEFQKLMDSTVPPWRK
jgi:tetratricopeptide (TPR) repeat protein